MASLSLVVALAVVLAVAAAPVTTATLTLDCDAQTMVASSTKGVAGGLRFPNGPSAIDQLFTSSSVPPQTLEAFRSSCFAQCRSTATCIAVYITVWSASAARCSGLAVVRGNGNFLPSAVTTESWFVSPCPSTTPSPAPVVITEAEVLAAQSAWCQALVGISTAYKQGGQAAAAQLAASIIDAAYGYNLGPVLFKPTLTFGEQTVRSTRAGALAYFVGGDANFPNDNGFALKGWTDCQIQNAVVRVEDSLGLTMGKVHITNNAGVTTVDKTWGFKKSQDGSIRIVLHHSSLPFDAQC